MSQEQLNDLTTCWPLKRVAYVLDGETVFHGIAEHVTNDGWIGIRQPHDGNRLDEVPGDRCTCLSK